MARVRGAEPLVDLVQAEVAQRLRTVAIETGGTIVELAVDDRGGMTRLRIDLTRASAQLNSPHPRAWQSYLQSDRTDLGWLAGATPISTIEVVLRGPVPADIDARIEYLLGAVAGVPRVVTIG
jgi:hypothetical protein